MYKNYPSTGACEAARDQNPSISCTPDGLFETLQCQEENGGIILSCQCLNPISGESIPGTQVVVATIEDAPDCDASCEYIEFSSSVW